MPISTRQLAIRAPTFAALAMALSSAAHADLTEDANSRLASADLRIFDVLEKKISRGEAAVYSGAVIGEVNELMRDPREKYTALVRKPGEGKTGFTYSYFVPATKDLPTSDIYVCYGDKQGVPLVEARITPQKEVIFIAGASAQGISANSSPATCSDALMAYGRAVTQKPK